MKEKGMNRKSEIDKIWNETYSENNREELGWYETVPEPSFTLIEKYLSDKKRKVLDVGCGESTLIQYLIDRGFRSVEGIDLSSQAIKFLEKNLSIPKDAQVILRTGDLTEKIAFDKKGGLWHDRAVFHFFLDESQRKSYKKNLESFLEDDGIFILACFSKENEAEKCNGFTIHKYTVEELEEFFGDCFRLEETFAFNYIMPWGDIRKYIYCVFSKNDNQKI